MFGALRQRLLIRSARYLDLIKILSWPITATTTGLLTWNVQQIEPRYFLYCSSTTDSLRILFQFLTRTVSKYKCLLVHARNIATVGRYFHLQLL